MNCSTLGEIGVGLSASSSCTGMIFLFSPEVFENADTENKKKYTQLSVITIFDVVRKS